MIQLLALVQVHHDLAFHILTVLPMGALLVNQSSTYHENGCFVRAAITVFNRRVLATLRFRQFDINLAWWAHVEQRAEHFARN